MSPDTYIKIQEGLFKLLVAGKEVVVGLPDGFKIHIILDDMGCDRMFNAILDAEGKSTSRRDL